MSEHLGMVSVPIVGHYKHLGGLVVTNGSKLHEIKAPGATMMQNVAPLKSILANQRFHIDQRRMLLRFLGTSVVKFHAGTWFALTQGEIEAWHAVIFNTYHLLEKRAEDGSVNHKEMYDLAHRMQAPMPIEFWYLERLRLLIHMIQVQDTQVITAILHNFQVANKDSWLYGAIKSVQWAQTQPGRYQVPDELMELNDWQTWRFFSGFYTRFE